MKYKILIILFFLFSCSAQLTTLNKNVPYSANGFAYIYNHNDFNEKIIKGKMDNKILQISHQNLKTGSLLKITNPKNKKNLILKNIKRIKYPDFYKILITEAVANELELDIKLPLLEIVEIRKNKSFVAEKAKIYIEEKKIPTKAPVASVQVSNISKNKLKKAKKERDQVYINLGSFYSIETAKFLRERIIKDVKAFDIKKLKIKKIHDNETLVISGPYYSINLLKNDYIHLKNFGFEELDILLNE